MMRFVRLLARGFRAAPIIWIAAILSLALGIGAQTAVLSIVNSLSLTNLSVAAPHQLVTLTSTSDAAQNRTGTYSYATFDEIRRQRLFDGALAWSRARLTLDGTAEALSAAWVSGDFFSTLRVPAAIGRTFTPTDDVQGGGRSGVVAMISDRVWERRFGRAPEAIGRALVIERTPVTIVGVTPPSFSGVEVGQAYDIYLPSRTQSQVTPNAPSGLDMAIWTVMLRLRDGQSIVAATQALRAAQADIRAASAPTGAVGYLQEPFVLVPTGRGTSALRDRYETPLLVLFVVATLVLLVACANVANLMLVRGVARRKELSVRLALGASRGTLIRELLSESFIVAAPGVVLGLIFASWASHVLVAQFATGGTTAVLEVTIDWRVLVFASVAGIAAAMLFGVAPALRATHFAPVEILNADGRNPGGGTRLRGLNIVLVAQTALALVLVLAAGLFVRTFQQLTRVPLGFNAQGVLSVTVSAPHVRATDRNRLYHRLVESVSAVPSVAHAGGGLSEPLRRVGIPIALSVSGARSLSEAESLSYGDDVTPGWRSAYGLELRAGRDIDERDVSGGLPVALVNEAFVRRFFPSEDIVGRTLSITAHIPPDGAIPIGERTVIGVVADAVHDSIRSAKRPMFYRPLAQRDGPLFIPFHLAVRPATLSVGQLAEQVAAALRAVDPELRLTFATMAETVDAALAEERLLARLSAFGGGFALLLAAVGLYGVTAYSVASRRPEIAIRLALGGAPITITKLVLLQLSRTLAIGITLGAATSVWAAHFLSSLLFGVSPRDPLVLTGGVLTLAIIGIAAAFFPAYRASLSDPAGVLRNM
jgi:predicted permease